MKRRLLVSLIFPSLLVAIMCNSKAGTETFAVLPLQEVVRTVGLSDGDKVSGSISIFGISLELFIILVVIMGTVIVGSIVVAIKKLKTTPIENIFEEALEETLRVEEEPLESKLLIELTEIKGIGLKRAEKLKAAGINTVSDLAVSSAKYLSQKTGIPEKNVSRWIERAREIIE